MASVEASGDTVTIRCTREMANLIKGLLGPLSTNDILALGYSEETAYGETYEVYDGIAYPDERL